MAVSHARRVEQLRFVACGSVDDGKSTLIGRLLHDSRALFEDQLEELRRASPDGGKTLNLAFLTDGLKAERREGMTIDIAHRYFATPRRRFIVIDCPGHLALTRNMLAGASTADLALLLVDAARGLDDQGRRHALLSSLLRIPRLVVCVNKMDLADYRPEAFAAVRRSFREFAAALEIPDVRFVPVSALTGDNVVKKSSRMPWYQGPSLLRLLEGLPISSRPAGSGLRLPIQGKLWPAPGGNPLYTGRIVGGELKKGDRLKHLPSGRLVTLRSIEAFAGSLPEAVAAQSVAVALKEDLPLRRGDMLVGSRATPRESRGIEVTICWLSGKRLSIRRRYILRHTTREMSCTVTKIIDRLDLRAMRWRRDAKSLGSNDIGRVRLRTAAPLFYDRYRLNKSTGSLILIDERTGETLAAGMIS